MCAPTQSKRLSVCVVTKVTQRVKQVLCRPNYPREKPHMFVHGASKTGVLPRLQIRFWPPDGRSPPSGATSRSGTCQSNARADLMSASEEAPALPEWPGWAQNGRDWPEADGLLLAATHGEADTHYKILVRSFR